MALVKTDDVIGIGGVSKTESVTQTGASWKAALGAVTDVALVVRQSLPKVHAPISKQLAGPAPKEVAQFAGNAGGTMLSKPSQNILTKYGGGVGVGAGVG